MQKQNVIVDLSMGFAVRIVNLYKYLTVGKKEYIMSRQLLILIRKLVYRYV